MDFDISKEIGVIQHSDIKEIVRNPAGTAIVKIVLKRRGIYHGKYYPRKWNTGEIDEQLTDKSNT